MGFLSAFVEVCDGFDEEVLKSLHQRREVLFQDPWQLLLATVKWRWLVGLGNPSLVENGGLCLHSVYGFPIVPASSLRGLARHYLSEEFEYAVEEFKGLFANEALPNPVRSFIDQGDGGKVAEWLFGQDSQETDPQKSWQGSLVVLDAWPTAARGWFELDVLTPHFTNYRSGAEDWPDDTEKPAPHQFLALQGGTVFKVPIGLTLRARQKLPDANQQAAVTELGVKALRCAMEDWGVCGRTGSGYGRGAFPEETRSEESTK
ncbi:MAG: type III-B CRISPR module RAMP protein Cmr6 [Acidobacteria bacterium]|nr:type III-B CRISPR module RAMP protein Cmr6 [Acidobacteriota bacterium]